MTSAPILRRLDAAMDVQKTMLLGTELWTSWIGSPASAWIGWNGARANSRCQYGPLLNRCTGPQVTASRRTIEPSARRQLASGGGSWMRAQAVARRMTPVRTATD